MSQRIQEVKYHTNPVLQFRSSWFPLGINNFQSNQTLEQGRQIRNSPRYCQMCQWQDEFHRRINSMRLFPMRDLETSCPIKNLGQVWQLSLGHSHHRSLELLQRDQRSEHFLLPLSRSEKVSCDDDDLSMWVSFHMCRSVVESYFVDESIKGNPPSPKLEISLLCLRRGMYGTGYSRS